MGRRQMEWWTDNHKDLQTVRQTDTDRDRSIDRGIQEFFQIESQTLKEIIAIQSLFKF